MIGLDVHSEIGAAIEAVGETPQRVRPAVRRALRQTGTKMWKPVRAEAAKRANVPARALSRRVFRSLRRERDALSIWFGTYNVALSKLGTARQTGTGVKVGRRFFPGAFLGRGKLAGRGVFRQARALVKGHDREFHLLVAHDVHVHDLARLPGDKIGQFEHSSRLDRLVHVLLPVDGDFDIRRAAAARASRRLIQEGLRRLRCRNNEKGFFRQKRTASLNGA